MKSTRATSRSPRKPRWTTTRWDCSCRTRSENLEKLIADTEKTGKFDYELCYLLRKQETLEDLEDWMKQVLQKRRGGDPGYGRDMNANRFNNVYETVDSSGSFFVVMNALPHLRFIKMSTRCPKTKLTETPSAPKGSN
jgi:hypothetical protein